ncbi:membrane protein [Streptomyces rubellomurinus subsp. indigoferus]|nr:membrane protein [Streptomyces rubellomurinus subsp. indigoferus]
MPTTRPRGPAPTTGERLLALGSLPAAAAVLTGMNALYLLLVVFGNVTDFATNQHFVQHVLAMDTTFRDEHLMWRSITSPALQNTAYVAIIAWEALSALVLTAGTLAWWLRPQRARRLSSLGLLLMLLLFGAGFIGIGGEWFAMWQSKTWNGLDAAIRNVTLAGLALVVVNLPHRPPAPPP